MSLLDDVKSVAKTLNDIGKVDEYRKLLESWQTIMEMQESMQKIQKENSDLKEKLKIKSKLVKDKFVYFLDEDKTQGPFCTRCWEKDQNLITLQKNKVGHWNFMCPECNNKVTYRE